MPELIIYGASDDLLEIDGHVRDEFYLASDGTARVAVYDVASGQTLHVTAAFGAPNSGLDWTLSVEARDDYPSWPIRFGERPDYENDPAVFIEVPKTVVVQLEHGVV